MASNSMQKRVNLIFETNTSQATSNLQQLNQLLQQIGSNTKISVDGGALQQAAESARQLQIHLNAATNVNTGKLDLTKLNKSLKSSGTDLQSLAMNLRNVGPQGEQAFLKLANAISHAEVPMVRMNQTIQNFMTTLANTAKWQVASTMIHGVVGAFQNAVGHAKNLNKALNDIQIVTGYTSNTMANLARDASAAASALNTTTTEYAKAALIFYQQGLSGSAVSERADTVIKLAQVTGQSAELVSEQMTAIWNNFDDGSETLEYYADALTKLGATTAASTSEIAAGLQKFSAIADTVGLSYETAAAAIATVIDKTKESAEVVGTAFKTILGRVQSLSLGETLDDGVDLTKYSEALDKVGVSVLTADGRLRDMDDILDDLGEKWDGLGRETQVALAQTVGGVRQYNQVMSIMNNWEDVEANIEAAKNAQGELNAQHKTWSASYEASVNKLKKAKDDLYEKLINDEFLIKINDILRMIIETVSSLIDRFGGLGGTITVLVGIFSKQLFPVISSGFKKAGEALYVWSGKAQKDISSMQTKMQDEMTAMVDSGKLNESTRKQVELTRNLSLAKQKLAEDSKYMTEAQKKEAEAKITLLEAMTAETTAMLEQQKAREKRVEDAKESMVGDKRSSRDLGGKAVAKAYGEEDLKNHSNIYAEGDDEDVKREKVSTVVDAATNNSVADLTSQIKEIEGHQSKIIELQEKINKIYEESAGLTDEEEEKAIEAIELAEKEIKTLEAKADQDRENLIILKEAYNLRLKMNKETANEQTSFGIVKGASAGEMDETNSYNSERISLSDAKSPEEKTQASAADSQMSAIASDLGNSSFESGGGLAVQASIENYEKLYEVIGKQVTMINKLDAAEQDLEKTISAENAVQKAKQKLMTEDKKLMEKLTKDHDISEKAYKKLSKTAQEYVDALREQDKFGKNNIKTVKEQKTQYLDLAKKAGLTGAELEELEKTFDALDESAETNPENLQKIKNTFEQLSIASEAVESDLRNVAIAMQDTFVDAGVDEGQLNELTAGLEDMANSAPELDGALENTEDTFDSLGDKTTSFTEKLGTGIEMVTQLGAQFMATKTAIDGLSSAFAEGAGPMEIITGIMTTMLTLLPLINTLTQISTALKKKDAAASGTKVAADLAEAGATGVKTAATWASVAANIASWMSNPWTIAIGIACMAAIAIAVAAITKYNKANEQATITSGKLTEAQRENAQASVEQGEAHAKLVDAWLEQMHTMDELIARYEKLNNTQNDTSELTKEILDSVDDQIEAYDKLAESMEWESDAEKASYDALIEQLKVAQTAEDVATVTTTIDTLLAGKQEKQLDKAQQSAVDAMVSDIFTESDTTTASTDDGKNIFIEDIDSGSIIKSDLDNAGLLKSWTGKDRDGIVEEGWLGAQLRTDSKENFIADYEKLVEVYENALEKYGAANMGDDKGALAIKRIIEATQDTYNSYKDIDQSKDNATIANAALTAGGLRNINNYDTYLARRQVIIDSTSDKGISESSVDDYLADSTANTLYANVTKRIQNLANKGLDKNVITNMLKGFNDEELQFFLDVDLNKYKTEAAIKEAIEIAKIQANQEEIELNIVASDTALKALKNDGMATDDWEAIRDSGVDFSKAGGFANFMEMSYAEQKKYLEGFKATASQQWVDTTVAGIAKITAEIEAGKVAGTLTASEIKYLEQEKQALQEELIIRKEIAKTEKIQLHDLPVDEVNAYTDALINANELTADAANAAVDLSIANFKLQRGLDELNGSFDEIEDGLLNNTTNSIAYTQALTQLRTIVGDISGLDVSLFDDSFFTNNLETIGKLARGDGSALGTLREAMANAIWSDVSISDADITDIIGHIDYSTLKTGDSLDATILTALKNSGLANEAIQQILSALGYSIIQDATGAITGAMFTDAGSKLLEDYAKERQIDVYEYDDKQKIEFDAYDAYNRELEQIETNLSKIADSKNKAFGQKRLDAIDDETEALQEQLNAQQALQSAIEANINAQQSNLSEKYGLVFDENDNASNLNAITESYVNNYNAAYDAYAAAHTTLDQQFNAGLIGEEAYNDQLEAIEDTWTNAQKIYEKFTEDIVDYDSDIDLFRNSEQTLNSIYNSLSAANLEKVTYAMEFKLEIDQKQLDWLDYKLNKIADDFYSQAEAAVILIGSLGNGGAGSKLGALTDNVNIYSTTLNNLLNRSLTPGDDNYISDDKFKEGLDNVYSSIMNDLSALQELDNTMIDYYSNTITMASDELSKHTARMEHHTAVLDHYKNLISLIDGETDYKSIAAVLNGQAQIAQNTANISKSNYEMFKAQADDWKAKMDAATDSEAFELYQKNWETAEEKAREAEDKMLSDLAAWAESEKAILENTLADLGKTLEETLTGGLSFDKINTQMERAASLQEEYLTTTNKIYETTKMMRTAQQAIDATSNVVAKEKLKQFITQTKSLQEQGKLSQYELDTQQAKYNLLVAEIALEEAQHAKNTVRLQRDSEGNFGYVYTANAEAVSAAQQQFDDAQNALYNKGLEGANDYTQKYQATMSEMTSTLSQIQSDYLAGMYNDEEEYQAAMMDAKQYYFEKLQNYSTLYGVAITTDSRIASDAWSTDFASMTTKTDQWSQAVNTYIESSVDAFTNWASVVANIKQTTGGDLNELAMHVQSIVNENDAMADALNGEDGVIKSLEDELTAVNNLTEAYAKQRKEVQDTITALETLANNAMTVGITIIQGSGSTAIPGAATGGLTSNWGPEGKLLTVHESELILNKDETNTFFNHLALMENILSTLDFYALGQQIGGILSSPSAISAAAGALEQNVKIEATFPNVQDKYEIEEAFNNLVNKASQYANRQ